MMDRRLSVLTVAGDLADMGGLDRCQLEICRGLGRLGHRIHVVHQRSGPFHAGWASFATTRLVPTVELPHRLDVGRTRAFLRTVAATARLAPDIVYAHHYRHLDLASWIARRRRTRLALHLHVNAPASLGRVGRRLLARVDALISVSRATADTWMQIGVPADRVHVALNGVDLDRYTPAGGDERARAREELGVGGDEFVGLVLGRLDPSKGIDVAVDAWKQVVGAVPRARLLVVGGTAYSAHPDAVRWVADMKRCAGDHVTWIDHVHDPRSLLRLADVVVVPSRWPDPCPLVVAEGLACGTPVVGSRIGGIPEELDGLPPGWLVLHDDADALAEAVMAIAASPDRDSLRAAARAHAESHLALTSTVARVAAILGS